MQKIFSLGCLLLLVSCAATQVEPQAQRVFITRKQPPMSKCKYLGDATGSQGNFFSGAYTSNKNLETGARNDLKNQASQMGGNVVYLLTDRAGETGNYGRYGGGSRQTNVTLSGSVFRCALKNM